MTKQKAVIVLWPWTPALCVANGIRWVRVQVTHTLSNHGMPAGACSSMVDHDKQSSLLGLPNATTPILRPSGLCNQCEPDEAAIGNLPPQAEEQIEASFLSCFRLPAATQTVQQVAQCIAAQTCVLAGYPATCYLLLVTDRPVLLLCACRA